MAFSKAEKCNVPFFFFFFHSCQLSGTGSPAVGPAPCGVQMNLVVRSTSKPPRLGFTQCTINCNIKWTVGGGKAYAIMCSVYIVLYHNRNITLKKGKTNKVIFDF